MRWFFGDGKPQEIAYAAKVLDAMKETIALVPATWGLRATRSTYTWVPQQAWDRIWSDEELYKKYKLTADEVAFIESMVRPMEAVNE